jgi:hypothetical protein
MEKKKTKNNNSNVIEPITFTKEKILKIRQYRYRIDLLNVLLDDGKAYTTDEVDALIDKFMKGKVN